MLSLRRDDVNKDVWCPVFFFDDFDDVSDVDDLEIDECSWGGGFGGLGACATTTLYCCC